MNAKQFSAALAIAQSNADLSQADDSALFGYGLPDFKPVNVSLAAVAKTLRWQALQFNGQFNSEEISNCRYFFCKLARVQVTENALRDCIKAELSAIAADGRNAVASDDMHAVESAAYKLRSFSQYVASNTENAVKSIRNAVLSAE
jgi:hypothetical protein